MTNFTDNQKLVLCLTCNLVVVGRPGSGKTTVALEKAETFIRKNELEDYQRVLFLSFSKAAVHRIREANAQKRKQKALRGKLSIQTFHSFCLDFLRSHSRLGGVKHPFQVLLPQDWNRIRFEAGIDRKDHNGQEQKARELEVAIGGVHFDRFAPIASEVLKRHPTLAQAFSQKYPLIIVDEYQDTDNFQDDLLRRLAIKSQLLCLGDDDQRIYDFRPGTSPERLRDLEHKYGFTRIDLETISHRSGSSGVLEFGRAVLHSQRITMPAAVAVLKFSPRVGYFEKKVREAIGQTFSKVKTLSKSARPTIALMMRTNNDIISLSRYLSTPGVSGKPTYHTVLISLEEAAAAWKVLFRILECNLRNHTVAGIDLVLDDLIGFECSKSRNPAQSRLDSLRKWRDVLRSGAAYNQGFPGELRKILLSFGAWSGNPSVDLGRIIAHLKVLDSVYTRRALELAGSVDLLEAARDVLAALSQNYHSPDRYADAVKLCHNWFLKEQLTEGRKVSPGLTLMTMHKCKGKEFDAVILAERSGSNGSGFIVNDEVSARHQPQSRRLLHTAITRARHYVAILTPANEPCELIINSCK